MGASRGWRRSVRGVEVGARPEILENKECSRFFYEKILHHEERRVLRYAALLMKQGVSAKLTTSWKAKKVKINLTRHKKLVYNLRLS
jgi:hypothetical protein